MILTWYKKKIEKKEKEKSVEEEKETTQEAYV